MADTRETVVWSLDTTDAMHRHTPPREKIAGFLRGNGVDADLVMVGAPIVVREDGEGRRWLDTWQALDGDPLCEHCPSCVKQAKTRTPPVVDPPQIGEAYDAFGEASRG